MRHLPPDLKTILYRALGAFGASIHAPTEFARYWNAVGAVEDYAAVAETPGEQTLVVLLRLMLERELRRAAPFDEWHEDARGVEEVLQSPRRRRRK